MNAEQVAFVNLPILTPRLLIRAPEISDAKDIITAVQESRAELQRWMSWATPWPDDDALNKFVIQSVADFSAQAQHRRLECFDRISGRFLVSLGCSLDAPGHYHLSYWTRSSETGKGYTTEAVTAFIDYLFNFMNVEQLETSHEVDNLASQRVIEKCGFIFEKNLDRKLSSGKIRSERIYNLKKSRSPHYSNFSNPIK